MFVRSFLALLTATLLAVSFPASAIQLTLTLPGLFLTGLGSCEAAPLGCTDPAYPPGSNSDGPYDQLKLVNTSILVDTAVNPGFFVQPFVFLPGNTGGGSVGFVDEFLLTRSITIKGTNLSGQTVRLNRLLEQDGSLTVGWFEDTLLINASSPLTIDLGVFGLTGSTLTLQMSSVSVTAGLDPEGEIDGRISISSAEIPLPSTLLLVALGLMAGLGGRTRKYDALASRRAAV